MTSNSNDKEMADKKAKDDREKIEMEAKRRADAKPNSM